MRLPICILILTCIHSLTFAQAEKDYTAYHRGIINAEHAIFVSNDSIKGLNLFKSTFGNFEFAWVDDCIEAFELALYFKRENEAMLFLKKALDNGFELNLLNLLTPSCSCNLYAEDKKKVTIYEPFIAKNKTYFEDYSKLCYSKYLQRINKDLLAALLKRHVKEQLFKNYHKELGMTMKKQAEEYAKVCDDNLHFMDSLAHKGIFIGERNTGIYTIKLAKDLQLPLKSIQDYEQRLLISYDMAASTYVPVQTDESYFDIGAVYNMLWHNARSYEVLAAYKDEAIKKGYLHPREYANIKYNHRGGPVDNELYLHPSNNRIANDRLVDEKRKQMLLPDYETDFNKHVFAHKHNLMLCFGWLNGGR